MTTTSDRQEALSFAYVMAVAAYYGMTYSVRSKDFGIDLTLHTVQRRESRYFETDSRLDLQIKSTTTAAVTDKSVEYDLTIKNYDDLRVETDQERILVLLVLPRDEDRWLRHTETRLELRQCMYWTSLRGRPPVPNHSSIRVTIPRSRQFSPDQLSEMMDRVRKGRKLT